MSINIAFNDRKLTVLIVEDDPINACIISEFLSENFLLVNAKTRQEAFQQLNTKDIDIIILDINLPDGNGFEICEEIISNKQKYGAKSIVFLTSCDQPEDEAKGIEIGGSDYITKPINPTVLQVRVNLQARLIRQAESLSQMARIDATTHLYNRRAFDEQLKSEWNRACRDKQPLSLCMIDLDCFKQFNDTYGHPEGDKFLYIMAKLLRKHFKRSSDFIARYGGEEFVLILSNTDLSVSQILVSQALDALKQLGIPHKGSSVSDVATFSAGICTTIPKDPQTAEALLNNADTMLYTAKTEGRACVRAKQL